MYLIGASGHAKVIIDILQLEGKKLAGLFDDNPQVKELRGVKCLGPVRECIDHPGEYVISIGSNSIRKKISEDYFLNYIRAIHPAVVLDSTAEIGVGTVVMASVTINSSVKIGIHVIINTSASIDHDCMIDDFVHISPNATLSGNVMVGEGTHIGAGATIIQGIKIGKWCTVGAGAVVINDIPDGTTVVGVPAKPIKFQG